MTRPIISNLFTSLWYFLAHNWKYLSRELALFDFDPKIEWLHTYFSDWTLPFWGFGRILVIFCLAKRLLKSILKELNHMTWFTIPIRYWEVFCSLKSSLHASLHVFKTSATPKRWNLRSSTPWYRASGI